MSSKIIRQKIEAFFEGYTTEQFKKGHVLVQADEPLQHIYYLVSGQVIQYDISNKGVKVIVNVFKPGAFFPMSWAINQTPNNYFLETAADSKVKLAPPEAVVNFLKSNPDVTFDLVARVYSGTDGLLRRMAHLMGGSASTRLMFELIVASRRFGRPSLASSILISLHEEELANRAGLTRETVSRELIKLKKLGLVEVDRHHIRITNLAALEELLGDHL